MNWHGVEFCPRLGELDIRQMSQSVACELFAVRNPSFEQLIHDRYAKMRELKEAPLHDARWDMPGTGCEVIRDKREDARLKVSVECVRPTEPVIQDLFRLSSFGVDLPVWFAPSDGYDHKVMLVAQDPKRIDDPAGNVYLGSPFGAHARACVEGRIGRLVFAVIERLLRERCAVYLTDAIKYYALKPGYVESRLPSACERSNTFLAQEKDWFPADLIVAFGKASARVLMPQKMNEMERGFARAILPRGFRGEGVESNVLTVLHPSGQARHFLQGQNAETYYIGAIRTALDSEFR